jgi:predicted MFS family arabinose efflux permease
MAGGAVAATRSTADPTRRLTGVLAAAVVIGLALPSSSGAPALLVPVLFVQGCTQAPALAVLYALVPGTVPGRLTEAFSWMSTAIVGGIAVGTALAGVVVDAVGVPAGFGLGAVASVAALAVAVAAARGPWSRGSEHAAILPA